MKSRIKKCELVKIYLSKYGHKVNSQQPQFLIPNVHTSQSLRFSLWYVVLRGRFWGTHVYHLAFWLQLSSSQLLVAEDLLREIILHYKSCVPLSVLNLGTHYWCDSVGAHQAQASLTLFGFVYGVSTFWVSDFGIHLMVHFLPHLCDQIVTAKLGLVLHLFPSPTPSALLRPNRSQPVEWWVPQIKTNYKRV
jgi:hypothetical protein